MAESMSLSIKQCALLSSLSCVLACGGGDSGGPPSVPGPEPGPAASGGVLSLFGKPLTPPELSEDRRAEFETKLAEAQRVLDADPDDPDALIWLGRRTAYLGRYREAIEIFGRGFEKFPDDHRFLRHRGHRFITIRDFPRAVEDLEQAAALIENRPDAIEPDGLPNERNEPRSTSHSNIWYHLGLAYYLQGDFDNAARCYVECMKFSKNADMLTATTHWYYMTLRRLDRDAEAAALLEAIDEEMDVIENPAYHQLLLMYKGLRSPSELHRAQTEGETPLDVATLGYGIGNWYLYNHQPIQGEAILREVVTGEQWNAFGYIAAESELHRSGARLAVVSGGDGRD